jgi:hypothetical protein
MGTDIHLYIEKQNDDGTWSQVHAPTWPCRWCHGKGVYGTDIRNEKMHGEKCYSCEGTGKSGGKARGYSDRNYDLFAMLADVRNGTGFAGVDTGDGFEILAEPRGLPADTSIHDTPYDEEKEEPEIDYDHPDYVNLGDHSFSHCTLAEALYYDYTRTTKHRGVVNPAEYMAFREAGSKLPPKSYSGAVMGPGVKTVSTSEMDHLIQKGVVQTIYSEDEASDRYYTQVEWEETYRECAGEDWFRFLDACKTLGDPTKIRFVFGFDS